VEREFGPQPEWAKREGYIFCPVCYAGQLWRDWVAGNHTCPDCGASVIMICWHCRREYPSAVLQQIPWGYLCPHCGGDCIEVASPKRVRV